MQLEARELGINPAYLPPEPLWCAVEPLLPEEAPKPTGGRPRMPDRNAFFAIFYLLCTGCQWKALPRSLGAASTVHDRFQEWVQAGVFLRFWTSGLLEYDVRRGLCWTWQSLDGAMTKAPLGGQETGPNPTDRGKQGVKRHLLTEGLGLPIGLEITGANRHDMTQVEQVLETMPVLPPIPTEEEPQHFCADKGYDYLSVRSLIGAFGYEDHIKSRAEEQSNLRKIPGYRARRWVVERTHSWLNRFRRLLIRWEKKVPNYEALLHLAFAFICFRAAGVFG